jgi:hypothetical protein
MFWTVSLTKLSQKMQEFFLQSVPFIDPLINLRTLQKQILQICFLVDKSSEVFFLKLDARI